jgi:hypothetical protein
MEELERIPRKTEAQVVAVWRYDYEDGLGVTLRLEDGTELTLTFPLDSPVALDVLHAVADRIPDLIAHLGENGIVITSYSPPLVEGEQEDT